MIDHCYLIHGGEPLQTEEIIASISQQASKDGYNKKVVFEINTSFNWEELLDKCRNLDIFADRTVLELGLHGETVNKQGSQILEQVLTKQDPSFYIIIRAPKLKSQTLHSNWVKHIQKHGKIHVAKPISFAALPAWINKRLNNAGFKATSDAINLIARCYAGNLLAIAQFVQKISLVLPAGSLTIEQIRPFLEVNNQFSVFELGNFVLQGDAIRSLEICRSLRSDDADPLLVLWALTREIRSLLTVKHDLTLGISIEQSAQKLGLWRENLPAFKNALARLSVESLKNLLALAKNVDLICKGMQSGNAWDLLETMCLVLTGVKFLNNVEELHI